MSIYNWQVHIFYPLIHFGMRESSDFNLGIALSAGKDTYFKSANIFRQVFEITFSVGLTFEMFFFTIRIPLAKW